MGLLTFTPRGIYCAQGDFYIDPWLPVERAVITHAHSDHARFGMKKYLCHEYTKHILYARIGEDIRVQSVEYGETVFINGVKISLHPAGHIIGSAQVRMEYNGMVSVVSGDYKVADDGISTPIEITPCHEFVTESTFGLPIYKWQHNTALQQQMQSWVIDNQTQNKTSVFVGYSLGKAQRIMQMLDGLAPMYVHQSIHTLNERIEDCGISLPAYSVLHDVSNTKELLGNIVVVPPSILGTNVLKRIPQAVTAVCSGWMQVRGHRRWRAVDAGFAISDHADWDGLLHVIKETRAEKIFVTHGKTNAFAKYLTELGMQAEIIPTKFGDEEELLKEEGGKDEAL